MDSTRQKTRQPDPLDEDEDEDEDENDDEDEARISLAAGWSGQAYQR
jgi:hypothetical protein